MSKDLARAEREEFADLLDSLTPQQWDAATLCAGWRVREVVAHMISYDELHRRDLIRRCVAGRLRLDRVNALGVAAYACRTPAELIALVRTHAEPRGLPAGFDGKIALVDGLIHQQDIRRPLGLPRIIPPQRLQTALDFARYAPTLRGAWRARGVRLVATDLDWSYGRGPEVRGSGEALLVAMAGRRAALADLAGPGLRILASHLGADRQTGPVPIDRQPLVDDLERTRARLHRLLAAAPEDALPRPTVGTRWTNEQLLFHMVFGFMVVRALLPLVRVLSRLPRVARGFAALLDAGARPFHVVNFYGSCAAALVFDHHRMGAELDRVLDSLIRRLRRETDEDLQRGMPFPVRWDPFFTDFMTIAQLYRYPVQHFDFHEQQLSLDRY
jgi:uncharacterized protein (TIGR03083 family)